MSVVLASGCFDLLHLGHIRHLQEARSFGSRLVVCVTADEHVRKGAGRPHFTAKERAETLRALACVDGVIINPDPTPAALIAKLRPDIYVKGIDYDLDDLSEREACEAVGAAIRFTKSAKVSSSRIIVDETYPPNIVAYLERIRDEGFLPRIEKAFDDIKKMRVALIGETIIDEYVYVAPLAMPSKEFILCGSVVGHEEFAGGVAAAAAHLDGLCETRIVTNYPGERIVTNYPGDTIRKRRYVESGFNRKLFEVYESLGRGCFAPSFHRDVDAAIDECNVIIVIDFGHGLIDESCRSRLIERSRFLAVTAQTNAGNHGFNLITKYPRADYICVDLPEGRLAACSADAPPGDVIDYLADRADRGREQPRVIVTHGREGAWWYGGNVPAFATKPVDTMGAGDCFLAITAPLVAAGLGMEEAAFVGCVAAGMKTEIVGHRSAVDGEMLRQTVRSLLA